MGIVPARPKPMKRDTHNDIADNWVALFYGEPVYDFDELAILMENEYVVLPNGVSLMGRTPTAPPPRPTERTYTGCNFCNTPVKDYSVACPSCGGNPGIAQGQTYYEIDALEPDRCILCHRYYEGEHECGSPLPAPRPDTRIYSSK